MPGKGASFKSSSVAFKPSFKWDSECAASLWVPSSVFRRFFACHTSFAFSRAHESRFFVFWQLRLWQV
jgi:hypothetical protein